MRKFTVLLGCLLFCAVCPSHSATLDAILELPPEARLESAAQALEYTTNKEDQLSLNRFLSEQYQSRGNYALAIEHNKRAVQAAKDTANDSQLPALYKYQGVLYYLWGRYDLALESYHLALQGFVDVNEPLQQAHTLNNIGLVNLFLENLDEAQTYYKRAQTLYTQYGSEQDKADIMHNIAGVYLKMERYDMVLKLSHQVLERFVALQDKLGQSMTYFHLGVVNYRLGDLELAEKNLITARDIAYDINNIHEMKAAEGMLARVKIVKGDLEGAAQALERAKSHTRITEGLEAKRQLLAIEGLLLFAQERFDESADKFRIRHELAEQHMTERNTDIELGEILVAAAQHDANKSLTLYFDYLAQQTYRVSSNLERSLSEYEAKYDADRLQQQVSALQQQQKLVEERARQQMYLSILMSFIFLLVIVSAGLYYRRIREQQANVKLEEKVKQRTQELERLAAELGEANEIKSRFLANISHEIRTPLTAIIGQTQAVLDGDVPDAEVNGELQVVVNNGQHLSALINDLLDLSKIEANKLELCLSDVNIQSLLNDVKAMFHASAQQKGIAFEVHNTLMNCEGAKLDYIRTKQVLVNLCSNAIKFTDKGRVVLQVSQLANGLSFCVEDTGIGIAEDKLDAIFRSFSQEDNSISRRFGGTGLGLSLSQQLAVMMGGKISVASEQNKGSQFCFNVPCVTISKLSCDVDSVAAQTRPALVGSVLLAEDHPENRRLVERILKKMGLTTYTASDGEQAVELALRHYPDVILMDIQMPVMDGFEALYLLQRCGYTNPVIALTANAMTHDIERYLHSGFTDHLAKPIDKKAFAQTLGKYLAVESNSDVMKVDMDDLKARFESSFAEEKALLESLYQKGDFSAMRGVAHRLVGAAHMFANPELADLIRDIELAAKFEDTEQLGLLIDDLNAVTL